MGFDWVYQRLGRHLEIPGYLSLYVAYVDNEPASCGWAYFRSTSQFAGLYGGSTISKARKHGLYTALLAARVQDALRRGMRLLTIDATPMSRPIAARYGFERITSVRECVYHYPAET